MSNDTDIKKRAKKIVIYNHKGGVGKTTLTVNIAYALTRLGKRVLLVDSDPQCNLTSYLIEDRVVDDLLDQSDTKKGQTIWSGLRPVMRGEGDPVAVDLLESCGMFLLAGDIKLSEYEQTLGTFWGEAVQRRIIGYRGTVSLSTLVRKSARKVDADYVFYDAGPNIGPLNRVILLDCDGFIVPAACDLFSVRGLRTLGFTLAEWIRAWQSIASLAPDDIHLLRGKPAFCGYIPQQFRVYGQTMANAPSHYFAQLERRIHSDIIAVLREISPKLARDSIAAARLGEVRDVATLAEEAQRQGVPFALTKRVNAASRETATASFDDIAAKIVALFEGGEGK